MLRLNEYRLYELAVAIHPLTLVTGEKPYAEIWYEWFNARAEIEAIFTERPLVVCAPAAMKLIASISATVPTEFGEAVAKVPAEGAVEQVPTYRVYRVSSAAKEF